MQPKIKEARETAATVPSLEIKEDRPNPSIPPGPTKQVFCGRRQFPEGWSRWVEPEPTLDADEFLDDFGELDR